MLTFREKELIKSLVEIRALNKKIKKEKEKNEITYIFYNQYGLVEFSTNSKKEAKKFLKNCDVVDVNGRVAKCPVVGSFWTITIIEYVIRKKRGSKNANI
jgi:hypothetical protein